VQNDLALLFPVRAFEDLEVRGRDGDDDGFAAEVAGPQIL
jgi:hypothetical protein